MTDAILTRDVSLSWDCPACGAKAARNNYSHTLLAARCDPECTHIHTDREIR